MMPASAKGLVSWRLTTRATKTVLKNGFDANGSCRTCPRCLRRRPRRCTCRCRTPRPPPGQRRRCRALETRPNRPPPSWTEHGRRKRAGSMAGDGEPDENPRGERGAGRADLGPLRAVQHLPGDDRPRARESQRDGEGRLDTSDKGRLAAGARPRHELDDAVRAHIEDDVR